MRPTLNLCCAVALLCIAAPAAADELPNTVTLTFKTGYLELTDSEQTIDGLDREFDKSANDIFAFEGEARIARGENLAIGGEIFRYENKFRRAGVSPFENKMRTAGILAKVKYFFDASPHWQPYVGFGFGEVIAYDYSGPIDSDASGIGFQGVIGMQIRAKRIGVRVEYTRLHAKLEDDQGDEIRTSNQGVMVGLSLYLGK